MASTTVVTPEGWTITTLTSDATGAVLSITASAPSNTDNTNQSTLRAQAGNAAAGNRTYLSNATPTTAQAIAQVRALTQQINGLIRLVINQYDGTD